MKKKVFNIVLLTILLVGITYVLTGCKNENINNEINNEENKYVEGTPLETTGNIEDEIDVYDSEGPFYMPIEDIFVITGRGTVITGRVARGTAKVGDTIQIIGRNSKKINAEIISIEKYRKLQDIATIDENVGILLSGVEKDEVERGDAIVKPDSMQTHKKMRVKARIEDSIDSFNVNEGQTSLYVGTTEVSCKINATEVLRGEKTYNLEIVLDEDLPLEKGFLVRIRRNGGTIARCAVTEIIE